MLASGWSAVDQTIRLGMVMTVPSLEELEAQRRELFGQLAKVGDFRRGSVSQSCRRCGKSNFACARTPGHPGHGPRFADLSDQTVEINEAICEARPPGASTLQSRPVPPAETDGEKGGSSPRSRRRSPPR